MFWLPGCGQGVLPQCFGCLAVVKACCHSVLVAWLWSRRAASVLVKACCHSVLVKACCHSVFVAWLWSRRATSVLVKACCHSVFVAWLWSRRPATVFWSRRAATVFWLPGCRQVPLHPHSGQEARQHGPGLHPDVPAVRPGPQRALLPARAAVPQRHAASAHRRPQQVTAT